MQKFSKIEFLAMFWLYLLSDLQYALSRILLAMQFELISPTLILFIIDMLIQLLVFYLFSNILAEFSNNLVTEIYD